MQIQDTNVVSRINGVVRKRVMNVVDTVAAVTVQTEPRDGGAPAKGENAPPGAPAGYAEKQSQGPSNPLRA
jgi:hypothetical protein